MDNMSDLKDVMEMFKEGQRRGRICAAVSLGICLIIVLVTVIICYSI